MKRKRIGVVEDHASVVLGLRAMLDDHPGLTIAASTATVPELVEQAPDLDLVLLDLRLSDGSSPWTNVNLLHAYGFGVLVYTGAENPYLVRLAAKAGVLGILRKSESIEKTIEAIEAAAAGEPIFSTELAAAIDSDPDLSSVGLSARQEQVLALYASGENADRVARMTGLAVGTVIDYVGRIRAKYAAAGRNADTKVELYQRAVEDGVLPIPER